jgi:hypothetical protein
LRRDSEILIAEVAESLCGERQMLGCCVAQPDGKPDGALKLAFVKTEIADGTDPESRDA